MRSTDFQIKLILESTSSEVGQPWNGGWGGLFPRWLTSLRDCSACGVSLWYPLTLTWKKSWSWIMNPGMEVHFQAIVMGFPRAEKNSFSTTSPKMSFKRSAYIILLKMNPVPFLIHTAQCWIFPFNFRSHLSQFRPFLVQKMPFLIYCPKCTRADMAAKETHMADCCFDHFLAAAGDFEATILSCCTFLGHCKPFCLETGINSVNWCQFAGISWITKEANLMSTLYLISHNHSRG